MWGRLAFQYLLFSFVSVITFFFKIDRFRSFFLNYNKNSRLDKCL